MTEVGSKLSPKTHCFGDTTQNHDKWEKEVGSCSKDIGWLVMGECGICDLTRKALRRLETCFPKLLSGREGGKEGLVVHLWDLLWVSSRGEECWQWHPVVEQLVPPASGQAGAAGGVLTSRAACHCRFRPRQPRELFKRSTNPLSLCVVFVS